MKEHSCYVCRDTILAVSDYDIVLKQRNDLMWYIKQLEKRPTWQVKDALDEICNIYNLLEEIKQATD